MWKKLIDINLRRMPEKRNQFFIHTHFLIEIIHNFENLYNDYEILVLLIVRNQNANYKRTTNERSEITILAAVIIDPLILVNF